MKSHLYEFVSRFMDELEKLKNLITESVNNLQNSINKVKDDLVQQITAVRTETNTKIEQVITHSGAVTQTFTILGTIGNSAYGCIIKTGTITKIGFVSNHNGGFNINMFLANGDGSNSVNIGQAYYYGRGLKSYVYAYNIPVTEGQNITFNIDGNYNGEGMISATIWIQ